MILLHKARPTRGPFANPAGLLIARGVP